MTLLKKTTSKPSVCDSIFYWLDREPARARFELGLQCAAALVVSQSKTPIDDSGPSLR